VECKAFLRQDTRSVYDHYEHIRDLGQGGSGDVWLARQIVRADTPDEYLGRYVAIKKVRKNDDVEAINDFNIEVELMKTCDHPNICKLFGVFEDSDHIYLVLEYIDGGELFDVIDEKGPFSEEEASEVFQQVASAIKYCHKQGVVHHDIKPENILVVRNGDSSTITVKVIDFGFGNKLNCGQKSNAKVGTFVYSAPETLKGDLCDEKVDVWALGCLLYILLSGRVPFSDHSSIVNGKYSLSGPPWDTASADVLDLLEALLVVDPKERLGAAEVLDHPWLKSRKRGLSLLSTCGKLEAPWAKQMQNIKRFSSKDSFSHVATAIAARQMDDSSHHHIRKSFKAIDLNGDGCITQAEFLQAWKTFNDIEGDDQSSESEDEDESPNRHPTRSDESQAAHKRALASLGQEKESELIEMFQAVDMNCNDAIDYTEFVAACMDQRWHEQEEICWEAFRMFDMDGNGVVTCDNIKKVLQVPGVKDAFSTSSLDEIWQRLTGQDAEVDSPAASPRGMDQAITFDQFLKALRGVGKPSREQLAQRRLSRPQRLIMRQRTTLTTNHESASMANRASTDSSASCSASSRTSGISGMISLPGIRSRAASPDSMARNSSTRRRCAGPVSPTVSISRVSSSATLPILSRRGTSSETASKKGLVSPALTKDFGSGSDLGLMGSASTTASSQASPQTGAVVQVVEVGQSPSSCKWGQSHSYQSIPEGTESELRRSIQANCLSCAGLGCGLCRNGGGSPATARTPRANFMRSFHKIRALTGMRATPRKVHPQDVPRTEQLGASPGRATKLPLLGKSRTFGTFGGGS
jgi:calcium-dependent protein kinase